MRHVDNVSTATTRFIVCLQKGGIPMSSYTSKLCNTQFHGISLLANSRYTSNEIYLQTIYMSKLRYNYGYVKVRQFFQVLCMSNVRNILKPYQMKKRCISTGYEKEVYQLHDALPI